MKRDLLTIVMLCVFLAVAFGLTLLLELDFVRSHWERHVLVDVMILLAGFVTFKNIKELNR